MTAAKGNSPAWYVTGQAANQTEVMDDGRVIDGTRVFFRTANGTPGSVFIEQGKLSVETVSATIGQQAALSDAIDNLTG